MEAQQSMTIVQLPDACLLLIMEHLQQLQQHSGYVTSDNHNIANAARAHSRLHQAAIAAQRSIVACNIPQHKQHKQHKLKSLGQYLRNHAQYVDSLELQEATGLQELPAGCRLQQLCLRWCTAQLGCSSDGCKQGLLLPVRQHLTQLRVDGCALSDSTRAVAAALAQLPGLPHLSLSYRGLGPQIAAAVLAGVRNLTFLELQQDRAAAPSDHSASEAGSGLKTSGSEADSEASASEASAGTGTDAETEESEADSDVLDAVVFNCILVHKVQALARLQQLPSAWM